VRGKREREKKMLRNLREKSQLPDTGSVVGSACFADGFAEELVIQLIGRLNLQLDCEIL
jgi:hypothetical protein